MITDTDTFLPMDQTVFAMGKLVKSAERLIEKINRFLHANE